MDRRERYDDAQEAMRATHDGRQKQVWTALPGLIESFNARAITATVQPAIQGTVMAKDGSTSHVNLPLLVDVPVCFPHGGGVTLTFPVRAGDECLVVFASRCIDGWWQGGGTTPALDARMHDLSDGFAIVGPFSQKRVIANVSTQAAQLRTDDGLTLIEVAAGQVRVQAARVLLDTPEAHFTGRVTSDGIISSSADVLANTVSLRTHVHTGVQPGPSTTGQPVQ